MKTCCKCKKSLPLTSFQKCRKNKDGLRYTCKECRYAEEKLCRKNKWKQIRAREKKSQDKHRIEDRERRRIRYQNNPKLRLKIKEWRISNPSKVRTANAKYRSQHIVEERVHTKVHVALRSGKLKKQKCRICGKVPADAHHSDYSKPLEILWLCRKHHKAWHKIFIPEGT